MAESVQFVLLQKFHTCPLKAQAPKASSTPFSHILFMCLKSGMDIGHSKVCWNKVTEGMEIAKRGEEHRTWEK